jgi:hypothetical protein
MINIILVIYINHNHSHISWCISTITGSNQYASSSLFYCSLLYYYCILSLGLFSFCHHWNISMLSDVYFASFDGYLLRSQSYLTITVAALLYFMGKLRQKLDKVIISLIILMTKAFLCSKKSLWMIHWGLKGTSADVNVLLYNSFVDWVW